MRETCYDKAVSAAANKHLLPFSLLFLKEKLRYFSKFHKGKVWHSLCCQTAENNHDKISKTLLYEQSTG